MAGRQLAFDALVYVGGHALNVACFQDSNGCTMVRLAGFPCSIGIPYYIA